MFAVLLVSLAALLLVQASRANAAARSQWLARAHAVRLGAELAEWARRGGHHDLGMPLAQALEASALPTYARDCHDPAPACDPKQAAWHYLSHWRARLRDAVAEARFVVCDDRPPETTAADWACNATGMTQVLKIGRAGQQAGNRPSTIIDLGVAP
jgi:hypothetical protein